MDEIRKGAGGLRHVKEEEKSKKPSTEEVQRKIKSPAKMNFSLYVSQKPFSV